jgi:hypothetical protein
VSAGGSASTARARKTERGAPVAPAGRARAAAPDVVALDGDRDGARAGARDGARDGALALGWLTLLPLVAAYELYLALQPLGARNTAEVLVTQPFAAVLAAPEHGRWALLVAVTLAAAWRVRSAELALARRVGRVALEGLAAAALLGPLLLALFAALDVAPPTLARPAALTTPGEAALHAGGAAYEELVFRVALVAALGWLARAAFEWLLGSARLARVPAAAVALAGSAFVFAAAHLELVVGLFGAGGEPYDGARFAWRGLAGLALAGLYLARGVGVAAWCHAFFNLALALGAGPEVFL